MRAPGFGEDAAQHGRDRDDGRSHVETEAVAARAAAALPPSHSLRSKRMTLCPRAASVQAAESPPRPPPMIPMGFMSLRFSVLDFVDAVRRKDRGARAKRVRPRPWAARM